MSDSSDHSGTLEQARWELSSTWPYCLRFGVLVCTQVDGMIQSAENDAHGLYLHEICGDVRGFYQ
jgi:hypothetical protein